MIDTETLNVAIAKYWIFCNENDKSPSFAGIGRVLGISDVTVRRVAKGMYSDGRYYTSSPHISRCIANSDFPLVRELFEGNLRMQGNVIKRR